MYEPDPSGPALLELGTRPYEVVEGVVAQAEAGLIRILLNELMAVRLVSGKALNGERYWADTRFESVVFAVGDVATLPDCLRGGRTPSPRVVQCSVRSLRRSRRDIA